MNVKSLMAAGVVAVLGATAANATIYTVYNGIAAGHADFDTTATGAGAIVKSDTITSSTSGTSIDRGDYTITANDGGFLSSYGQYGTMSGRSWSIDPAGSTSGIGAFGSGITLTFDSPVNAFGFEVGDWATCCFLPSNLYISFDGGAPILVGSASNAAQGRFPSQVTGNLVHEIFVAAFDDSGTFSKVSFWGDGFGEVLVAGGMVKYALLDEGSLPPSEVPLPASGLLLAGVLGGGGMVFRRRRNKA